MIARMKSPWTVPQTLEGSTRFVRETACNHSRSAIHFAIVKPLDGALSRIFQRQAGAATSPPQGVLPQQVKATKER